MPTYITDDDGNFLVDSDGSLIVADDNPDPDVPALLLQSSIVRLGDDVDDGTLVTAFRVPWKQIAAEIIKDPKFLNFFLGHPREFEEFIAGAYDAAHFDEVILTPRSNDGGRDIIAVKHGFCSVRILGQTKAYKPGHLVTHDDVRAMLGVLHADPNASKAMIVTTSDFQPGVATSEPIQQYVPHRLELITGSTLPSWLKSLPEQA